MAVDDVFQITVSASQFGNLRQNTFAVIQTETGDVNPTDLGILAAAFKEVHRAQQHPSVTYTGWKARQVAGAGVTWPSVGADCTPTGGLFFEGTFLTDTTGGNTGSGEALPPQCALVTTLRSGLIGRSHRGRVFSYGYAEAQQTSGDWASGLLTNIETAWDSFYLAYAVAGPAIGWQFGIWSQVIASGCRVLPNGGHERVSAAHPELAFTLSTDHVTRSTVFTQRRRVSGHGL